MNQKPSKSLSKASAIMVATLFFGPIMPAVASDEPNESTVLEIEHEVIAPFTAELAIVPNMEIIEDSELEVQSIATNGGGTCPHQLSDSGYDLTYMGDVEDHFEGETSGSEYYRSATACYASSNDEAFVFWLFTKSNSKGMHLRHSSSGGNGDCNDSKQAYCIQILSPNAELNVNSLRNPEPSDASFRSTCSDQSFQLTIMVVGTGGGVGWGSEKCYMEFERVTRTHQEVMWDIVRESEGTHNSIEFDFGVVHKIPMAPDGSFESVLELNMVTNFHRGSTSCCTFVQGTESWELTASRITEPQVDVD